MKTNLLQKIGYPKAIAGAAGAIAIFAFAFVLVHAQAVPTVDSSIHNGSHVVLTTAPIGAIVHDNTLVASSSGPTPEGTVDFNLYSNTTCSGSPLIQTAVALATGTAESATTTVGSAGLSFKVHYNGQGDVYAAADGQCEPLFATSASVNISASLSTTTTIAGATVLENSTLSNATANATGTVAYVYYTNSGCTLNGTSAGTMTVANAVVPNSNSIQFNTAGTFYWKANYSGDQYNNSAASSCAPLVVLSTSTPPTPTPTPTPVPGIGSISGTVYNDLNLNSVKDSSDPGLSGFTVNLYNGVGWMSKLHLPIQHTVTDSNGNYFFLNLTVGTYSIEEIRQTGWIQTTGDFKGIVLATSTNLTGYNFANASTTQSNKPGNRFGQLFKKFGKDFKDLLKKARKENHDNKGNNGNHGKGDGDNDEDDE